MEKRFKNGLCLGKFMPIHNGHVHMILEAAKQCETVHVLVCSRQCEPISGEDRVQWANEIFFRYDNIVVHHCDDENPQYPEDNLNFMQIWHDSVYSYIPELDAIFASEDYVYPFAEILGVEPVLVDKERTAVPISGTEVRTEPFNHWEHIPKVVKDHYRLKIAVVGPESSGKSVLTQQLAEHYGCLFVQEYGRTYTTELVPTTELKPRDLWEIANEHNKKILDAEHHSHELGKKYLFIDTEAMVTKVFFDMYDKKNNWWPDNEYVESKDKIDQILKLQINGPENPFKPREGKIDLYLLTYPDLDWADDGTRDFPDLEDRMGAFIKMKKILDKNHCRYHIIMGKGYSRLAKAIEIIGHAEQDMREKPWHKLSFDR